MSSHCNDVFLSEILQPLLTVSVDKVYEDIICDRATDLDATWINWLMTVRRAILIVYDIDDAEERSEICFEDDGQYVT